MTTLDPATFSISLPIVLRRATRADLPRLEWFGQYTHYRRIFQRTYREQQQGRRLMLVADCENFPIGQIFVQLKASNPTFADGEQRAYLYSLRVMEMFRGRGIGTRLIEEAEQCVYGMGYRITTIAVSKDNPRALRLYRRLGYRPIGEDPGHWSYTDHRGDIRHVHDPCWLLEKLL